MLLPAKVWRYRRYFVSERLKLQILLTRGSRILSAKLYTNLWFQIRKVIYLAKRKNISPVWILGQLVTCISVFAVIRGSYTTEN
jgi:hypothetical protein